MTLDFNRQESYSILLLLAFYLSGVLIIGSGHFPDFILLTPLNLLVSIGVVLWNHPQWSAATWGVLLLSFAVGFGIEIIGINTGLIFGEYAYGPVLGWKILGTPPMIGINWALLTYCIGCTVNALLPQWSWPLRAAISASVMVLLDYFIEPVAIFYDMWTWTAPEVPLQNYLAWFVISWILLAVFHYLQGWIKNKVAYCLLIMQFLFFWALGQIIA